MTAGATRHRPRLTHRVRWALAATWGLGWTLVHLVSPAGSWHYFATGAHALFALGSTGGGLHLYHAHPELQIGPLSFLVAAPFALLPPPLAKAAAVLAMSAAGAGVVAVWARLAPRARAGSLLWATIPLAPAWEELAGRAGHLDDVLALTTTALALLAVRRGTSPVLVGVLLALAADAKPWALAFVPVLLVLPAGRRWRAALAWAAAVTLAWAPFVLADPGSLLAATYRIPNAAGSALRALGVTDPVTPWWCRPAQLGLGVAVGVVLCRRGRAAAVPFAVVAVRMLLDPATWTYYTAGLLATAVVVDLGLARRSRRSLPVPWFTLTGALLVYLPAYVHDGPLAEEAVHGWLRAAYLVAALGAAVTVPMRDLLRNRAAYTGATRPDATIST